VTRAGAALAAGAATFVLVAAAALLAWREGSSIAARAGGQVDGAATLFLVLLAGAFALYALGLVLLRRDTVALARVVALAVAIQLAPLAAPLLLSTDAWTYWAYGRVAAVEGANPYVQPPSAFPESPAFDVMGERWHETTSVYGPAFTLASEPIALAVDSSADGAAWVYKALAAAGALAATLLATRLARRRTLAAAFVGWNPLLAVHLAGGGHNDAWVGALVLAALALAAVGRLQSAGAAWVLAIAIKWVPVVFLGLRVIEAGFTRRRVGHLGFALAAVAVTALAVWRYDLDWLGALGTLAGNATLETSYALPHRLEQLGVPGAVATAVALVLLAGGLLALARSARRGQAPLGRAAVLLLATTPYLAVWYLAWAVPLAAADEDRYARLGCLAFGAYLLPQTIPL
jgi:hypothetical protein